MRAESAEARAERKDQEEREANELRLAKAMGHPLRVAILEALNAEPMAPVELARKLNTGLPNLSYHVRSLLELECIEKISWEPVRGSIKTTYRSNVRALFSDLAWSSLSPTVKPTISLTTVNVMASRVSDAFAGGTFDSLDDRHLSISTIPVNQAGWDEVVGLLANLFHRLDEIKAESAESGEELRPMSVGLLGFESPRTYE
jgi:DNA-binding transcriptional ArsR family regulator